MEKHTPGPWAVDGKGSQAIVRANDLRIVSIRHRLDGDEHEANARLIAAAPELLEALRSILPYVVTDVLEHCDGNKCREQWCAGCNGHEAAEAAVADANTKYKAACILLAKATGGE